MKKEMKETGNLSSQLTITLSPDDYIKKFETELKKYKDKAHLKGFRKGKTPLSAIKKMYGKGIMAEVIQTKVEDELSGFISEEKLEILGQPIPSEDQPALDFDLKDMGELTFRFDLGLAPQFDVKGVGPKDQYPSYQVVITDEMIHEEMENLQRRLGKQEEAEKDIIESDLLGIEIVENTVEDREPFRTEITVAVDKLEDSYSNQLLGKNLEFTFPIEDIFAFEEGMNEQTVKNYFLKDAPEDVGHSFHAKVVKIKRLILAELNQEFFDRAFGPGVVETADDAKEKMRQELESHYQSQGLAITKRNILEHLVNNNDLELPNEFLKRWLLSSNESLTAEQLESEYEQFEKNLRWTLVKNKLSKEYDITIEPQAIKDSVYRKLYRQFGAYNMEGFDLNQMVERVLRNRESVEKEYEELLAEEVMNQVVEKVSLVEEILSQEEYQLKIKDMQANIG